MNNILPLLKVQILQTFRFGRSKKEKKKAIPFLTLLLLVVLLGLVFSGFYSFVFMQMAIELNLDMRLIVFAFAGFASILNISTTVMNTKTTLFGASDYDLLASLPISKPTIIAVKLVSIYLVELLYSAIILLPCVALYVFYTQQLLFVVGGLLLILLTPVVAILIASLVGVVFGLLTDRFRFGNILTILFYLVFLGFVFYFSFILNQRDANDQIDSQQLIFSLKVLSYFSPLLLVFEAISIPIVDWIVYVGANLVFMAAMIVFVSLFYDYFHDCLTASKPHRKYVRKTLQQRGIFKSVFLLDLKRYFNSRMYLLNTITSGLVAIICSVVMALSLRELKNTEGAFILAPIMIVIVCWCCGLATPSSCAISMEGKTVWVMKTLPVSYRTYLLSKICLTQLTVGVLLLIGSLLGLIVVPPTVENIIFLVVLPQVYLFSMNCLGLLINLCFPKLNWKNENEAVKNSRSVVVTMLLDFLYTIVFAFSVIGLSFVNPLLAFLITSAWTLVLAVLIAWLLFKVGIGKLNRLEVA